MICENCGLGTPDEFKFCPRCGAALQRRVQVDRSKIKTPREEIFKAIRARTSTDEIVTPVWIYVMIVVYIAQFVAAMAIGFSIAEDVLRQGSAFSRDTMFEELKADLWIAALLSAIFYGFASILAYLLVSRQNRHFSRDRELRKGVLSLVNSAASSPELSKMVEGELAQLSQIDDQMNFSENKRNPIIWSAAVAVPLMVSVLQWVAVFNSESYDEYQRTAILFSLATLVSYLPLFELSYFLGKSIYNHHDCMMSFADETMTVLNKLGFKEKRPYHARSLMHRSYAIYILVTIVTLGLFMFYWWYTLIDDPNRHLKGQWDFEDSLVELISD